MKFLNCTKVLHKKEYHINQFIRNVTTKKMCNKIYFY